MARSGCSLLATLALASLASLASLSAGCGPRPAAAPAGRPAAPVSPDGDGGDGGPSRAEIELDLRGRLARVDGDACARQAWLKERALKAKGLRAEVTEELMVEQGASCRKLTAPPADAPTPAAGAGTSATEAAAAAAPGAPGGDVSSGGAPGGGAPGGGDGPRALPPEPVVGACTRARAEADLRARSPRHKPTRGQIDAEFERCFRDRIAACQLALDAEADEGFACWKADPWPEVPGAVAPDDIARTGMCLLELKGVIADLRKCREKKPAERDACVTPYIGYAPSCPLLKAERVWRAFPGREDLERVAKADAERRSPKDAKAEREARLKAEREAKLQAAEEAKRAAEEAKRAAEEARIAKEIERCFGRTTMEFADKLRSQPGPRTVPGCKYQVIGRVLSRNNQFVQVMDPSGPNLYMLRTKEPFAEGDTLVDRTATFDLVEDVELADGTKQPYAVFKLDPAPRAPAPKPTAPAPAPKPPAPPATTPAPAPKPPAPAPPAPASPK